MSKHEVIDVDFAPKDGGTDLETRVKRRSYSECQHKRINKRGWWLQSLEIEEKYCEIAAQRLAQEVLF